MTVLLSAVLGCLSGCLGLSDVSRIVDDARVRVRLGVLANTEVGWITETRLLEKAFLFYRQNKVDAVVITGHVTRFGYKNQYEVLDKVWKKVFGGTSVRLILQDGRYEVKGFPFAVSAAKPLGPCDVLTFHGEWKFALTDEICFYPRTSNRVCAGSMSGIDVQGGFERADEIAAKARGSAQGLLVSVYSGRTSIRRLDFTAAEPLDAARAAELRKAKLVYAEDVADPWEIGPEPEAVPPPQFWDDARLIVLPGQGKDGLIYTVKWPSVLKRFTGARARSYEVTVAFADDLRRTFAMKSVLSDGFYRSEDRDVGGVQCVFTAAELTEWNGNGNPNLVFAVTPIGFFGKRGKPIVSDPVPQPRRTE